MSQRTKNLPEYLKIVILLFQPALPLGLRQELAGGVRLGGGGSDVDGGGGAQGDPEALCPHIGWVGGIVERHQNRDRF